MYQIGTHGGTFGTRERGAQVRSQIIDYCRGLAPLEPLILDFGGVDLIGYSFADEVVGRLLDDRAGVGLDSRAVLIHGANEDVLEPIIRSLERRGLIGVVLEDDSIRLLGAPAHLQSTLEAARGRRQFTTAELAADLGIGISACNNRLKELLASGILIREPGHHRSGGREFTYQFASTPGAPAITV